jgi:anthranilate phosphoribosyltransferase
MAHLLAEGADPYQTGAFLLAMRMKSESSEELAGFVDAMREHAASPDLAALGKSLPRLVDVDIHADGREGRPQVSLAAGLVAASLGAPVLLRGAFSGPFAKNDMGGVLARLGVDPTRGPHVAARAVTEVGVAVVDLASYAPRLASLFALRAKLGVRTCVNSAVKLLDPAGCRRQLVGIFHGPYHAPMAGAARALEARRAAIVQAPGGVPEPQPDKPTKISFVDAVTAELCEPTACHGAEAPLGWPLAAPVPSVETAEALEALLLDVLKKPREAPAGVVRMTLLCASLMLWAAGYAPTSTHPEALEAAKDALLSGRAAALFEKVRVCYRA